MEGLELLGDLRVRAHDLLEKLGIGHGGHHGTRLTLAVDALPAAVTGPEGYVLDVAAGGSSVVGEGPAGLFHGLMSFVGLLDMGETATFLTEMVVTRRGSSTAATRSTWRGTSARRRHCRRPSTRWRCTR